MPTTTTLGATGRWRLMPVRIPCATPKPFSLAQLQRATSAHAADPARRQDSGNSSQRRHATRADPWRRPRCPRTAQALALLTLHPVHVPALPMLHIGAKAPNGTLTVYDRASGRRFVVYSPRYIQEFRGGHRAGLWYFRPATTVEIDPQSQGYMTSRAAVEALRLGQWGLPTAVTEQSRELAVRTAPQGPSTGSPE